MFHTGNPTPEPPAGVRKIEIRLPFADGPCRYVSGHLDLRFNSRHAGALHSLRNGLCEVHAVTADGRPVETVRDSFRWLFDQLAEASTEAGLRGGF